MVWVAAQFAPRTFSPSWGFAIAFSVLALETLLVARFAPGARVGPAVLAFFGAAWVVAALHGGAPNAENSALLTAALLAGGTAVGAVLGARIEHAGHLLAVALVSGAADLWSALAGPTAQLVEEALSQPERIALIALPWPLWGTGTIQPVLGVGDIVFVALYFAAYARHGLSLARAAIGIAGGFFVGLLLLLGLERAIPLLPVLGAGAVLADPRARALSRRELATVLGVTAVILVVLAARLWG